MDRGPHHCTGGSEQNHPKEKEKQEAKGLSEEWLQIVEEKREVKSKEEGERYIQLNADFQRTAQRHKKAFFNEWCIKLRENNRRGKTRDLFRKIGNIKRTFCTKMGTKKSRNGRGLVEADDIKEMERIYGRTVQKRS